MLRPLHWRENVRMKKQTSHKLSIKRWVILTLIFGFVATAGAVIIDIDYSMRQLKNETAAQYLSILNMQRESLDTDIGKASAILLSYKMSGKHINQLINCKDKNEAYFAVTTVTSDLESQILNSTISEIVYAYKFGFDRFGIALSSTSHISSAEKLAVKDYVESFFGNGLLLVGIMLLVTAALLTFAYYARPRVKEDISYRDAFIIGLSQAVAVLPGLSRSGTTSATGLMLGNKKEQVARFSFLMVIIPILGEALLDLMKGGFSPAESGLSIPVMIIGFLAAFVSGCLACKWMLRLVNNGKLVYFAIYCVAMGACAIIYSLVH